MSAQRYLAEITGQIEIYGQNGIVDISLKNISATGLCVESLKAETLKKGDLVRVKLILDSLNKTHSVNAEVVWLKGNMSGLNFIRADEVFEKMMDRKQIV